MKLLMAPALIAALLLSGCDNKKDDKTDTSNKLASNAGFSWSAQTSENAEIKIFDQYGQPIVGAMILIGDTQGVPFRGNYLTTDRLGAATVPADWTTPASVTVDAQGYIRKTILNQVPGNLTISLNTMYLAQYIELKGNVTGLPVVDGDKLIDFALAMPLMKKSDLLNLDLNQIISPYNDTISAAGQKMNVPSNVSLPKQKESYFIGITLDKPLYRLKVPSAGPHKYVATRGRFVFKQVVDELRSGKAFYEVINDFSILGGGIADTVLTGQTGSLDIPGTALTFNSQIKVNPVSANSDEIAMVLATADQDGYMVPTDVKRVTAGKPTTLQTIQNQPAYVINTIKKTSEFMANTPGSDRMSASVTPYDAAAQYKMLPLVANPTITNGDSYKINLPQIQNANGINPVATTVVISDLAESREGDTVITTPVRKWEIVGSGWNQQINLPKWPLGATPGTTAKKRVEINYVGSANPCTGQIGTIPLDCATHVTHASTDF
ncbi:MAG: hypothetical protein ACXVAX_10980 [Pseudobdellovibrio sp.]